MMSYIKKSNQLFRAGLYEEAIDMYKCALIYMPEFENIINFNIELALSRLKKLSDEEILKINPKEEDKWVSFDMLQSRDGEGQIFLGGMSIGFYSKEKLIPERVLKSANIFQLLSQVNASHKLATYISENFSYFFLKLSMESNLEIVHKFDECNIELSRMKYENNCSLRVLIEQKKNLQPDSVVILRAYQYRHDKGAGLVLVQEDKLDKKTIQSYKLSLINPYMPILMTLSNSEGVLVDASIIPYPSILDGGVHQSECAFFMKSENSTAEIFADTFLGKHLSVLAGKSTWLYGKFQVDIREAIGSELIFSKEFKEWLLAIFFIKIKSWRPPELNEKLEKYWHEIFMMPSLDGANEKLGEIFLREKKERSLLLPANAIPTIAILTTLQDYDEENNKQQCNFIVENKNIIGATWRYYWPDAFLDVNRLVDIDGAIRVPVTIVDKKYIHELNYSSKNNPLAILNISNPSKGQLVNLTPISPDKSIEFNSKLENKRNLKVSIVLTAYFADTDQFGSFIESIYIQSSMELSWLYFITSNSNDLKDYQKILTHYFKNRFSIKVVEDIKKCEEKFAFEASDLVNLDEERYLLFVSSPVICHDKRTISSLASMLSIPKAITASPMLVALSQSNNSEIVSNFKGLVNIFGNTSSKNEYAVINQQICIPNTIISVAEVSPVFFLTKLSSFKKFYSIANDKTNHLNLVKEFSENALKKGGANFLTQSISVTIINTQIIGDNRIQAKASDRIQSSNKIVAMESLTS